MLLTKIIRFSHVRQTRIYTRKCFQIQKLRSQTCRSTIKALIRLVKDYINRSERVEKITITKPLIKDCQNSYSLYKAKILEEKRQNVLATEKTAEEEKLQAETTEVIDDDIMIIKNGIAIAESSIKEGNKEL